MKKSYIYVFATLIIVLVYTLPNLEYLLVDIGSLKENIIVSPSESSTELVSSDPLPSFLESSSGVLESTNMGLTGNADPTVPLTYTDELVEFALQNDIDIYGVSLTEEEKQEMVNRITGNAELDANITNNATSNTDNTVSVNIRVVSSLAEFCDQ